MRSYEVMFIMAPTLEAEESEAIINRVTKVITDRGGAIQNIDRWGKRRLAYEIAGHRDGNYTVVTFQAPAGVGTELERVLGITDGVIRYLLVLQPAVKATVPAPKRQREAVPRRAKAAENAETAADVEAGAPAEA